MERLLVIDQDRTAVQQLGLECLERGAGVVMAENLCEGVRVLLETSVSVVLADAALLRLTPRESATLFDRVAPGAEVVVAFRDDASLEARVAHELAGFRTLTSPVSAAELLDKRRPLAR